jgi:cardiolipin synthase
MLLDWLYHWQLIVFIAAVAANIFASLHVVLHKRESVSALAWVGLIWLAPFLGVILYWCFGINRIKRRAIFLRKRHHRRNKEQARLAQLDKVLAGVASSEAEHLHSLATLIETLTGKPLLSGNLIRPLRNGEQAYPEMLQAIAEAKASVSLCTYIFDNDQIGRRFVDALESAIRRGVQVRVLIDDIGVHYSWPSIRRSLRRAGIPYSMFLPKLVPAYSPYANLCIHRKILVVDGRIGFSGGMNIRAGHDLTLASRNPVQDMHFRVEGPVVRQLQETFADDWHFSANEILRGDAWFPKPTDAGPVLARGISSGPDDGFEKMWLTFIGALTCAKSSVRIVTPYFLPDSALIAALNTTAMRGVTVDIILPEQNNLRTVKWASTALLPQVLERGCRVWLAEPPFDHAKLVLIDGLWTLLGSANWDPRSFRLNFEFDIECYDRDLAGKLEEFIQQKLAKARQVSLAELNNRHILVKIRDGVAGLLTPYL